MKKRLVFLIFILLCAFACSSGSQPGNRIEEVGVKDAVRLLHTDKNMVVLDVRTKKEFDSGHIAGAVNIDFLLPGFDNEISKLDRNRPCLVYCRTGRRSRKAAEKMVELGFRDIYHLEGGFNRWKEEKNIKKQTNF